MAAMSPWPTTYNRPANDSTPPTAMPTVTASPSTITLSIAVNKGTSAVTMAMLVAVVLSAARYDRLWNSAMASKPLTAILPRCGRTDAQLRRSDGSTKGVISASARIRR
ncbi:hypothetical protein D3C73_1172940 [compost metagenome]